MAKKLRRIIDAEFQTLGELRRIVAELAELPDCTQLRGRAYIGTGYVPGNLSITEEGGTILFCIEEE